MVKTIDLSKSFNPIELMWKKQEIIKDYTGFDNYFNKFDEEYLLNNFDKKYFDWFINNINNRIKNNETITDSTICVFCFIFAPKCEKCHYANNHGICHEGVSAINNDYKTIGNLIRQRSDFQITSINQLYKHYQSIEKGE